MYILDSARVFRGDARVAKCDTIKGVEKHGPDTDTAGKEGGLEGLTRTKEHPDQVEKDRSSFVCE